MSKLGMLLGVAAMMSAMSESNYTQKQNYKMKAPIEEWKRKTCKSCKNCGERCNKNTRYTYSKPTHKACRYWNPKTK